MTNEEAAQIAAMVADLWPNASLEGTRGALYARCLTVIPTREAAARAVKDLFITERFQPAPGDIIDRAMGLSTEAFHAWEALVATANNIAHRRPVGTRPPVMAVTCLRRVTGAGVSSLPVDDTRQLGRVRERFLDAYRDDLRANATETVKELTSAEHP